MNAQNPRGREGIVSTRIVFLFVPVLILFSSSLAQALDDWDIYSDTDIIDGQYNLINIYDTPPDHTTVNMYGGSADFISTFDLSILNVHVGAADVGAFETSVINILGGNIEYATASDNGTVNFFDSYHTVGLRAWGSGTVNMNGGAVDYIYGIESGIVNLYGGFISDYIATYDDFSVINVYGYDLVKTYSGGAYGYGQVYGFWLDYSSFSIDFDGSDTYSRVNLIPEPSSLIFLIFGALILRKRNWFF
jgi:hypothetical protein